MRVQDSQESGLLCMSLRPHSFGIGTLPYQYLIGTLLVPHRYPTSTSSVSYQYPTSTSSVSYQYPANTSSVSYQYPTSTSSVSYQYPTSTSLVPTSNSSVPYKYPAVPPSVPYRYLPVLHRYHTGTLTVPHWYHTSTLATSTSSVPISASSVPYQYLIGILPASNLHLAGTSSEPTSTESVPCQYPDGTFCHDLTAPLLIPHQYPSNTQSKPKYPIGTRLLPRCRIEIRISVPVYSGLLKTGGSRSAQSHRYYPPQKPTRGSSAELAESNAIKKKKKNPRK